MEFDIKINDRLTKVKLLSRDNNFIKVKVDNRIYDLDVCKVEKNESPKKYIANTYFQSFDMEIVDAETRYQQKRNKNLLGQDQNFISTPMPGKVVRIPVKVNEKVESGQSVIVISAMKMESEYKVGRDAVIKKILVKEGDTVKSNQPLIQIE
jgi:biotin carboxyl carrier protein